LIHFYKSSRMLMLTCKTKEMIQGPVAA